jgi:hypothetical protein
VHKLVKIIFFSDHCPYIAPSICEQDEISVDFFAVINVANFGDEAMVEFMLIDAKVNPSQIRGSC